jgi:hypothetical protein
MTSSGQIDANVVMLEKASVCLIALLAFCSGTDDYHSQVVPHLLRDAR